MICNTSCWGTKNAWNSYVSHSLTISLCYAEERKNLLLPKVDKVRTHELNCSNRRLPSHIWEKRKSKHKDNKALHRLLEEMFRISSAEACSEQVRLVPVRSDTVWSVLPLGGRTDQWSIPSLFSLILDMVSLHLLQFMKSHESKILWQNSLNSSALHHQPTFLEADASDAGVHQELWEDCVKFFCDQILQYQRGSLCWGDFVRYSYSLLVKTSRDAVTHWIRTISIIIDYKVWLDITGFNLRRHPLVVSGGTGSSAWITWRVSDLLLWGRRWDLLPRVLCGG